MTDSRDGELRELGEDLLAEVPRIAAEMRDRIMREVDAYRVGTVPPGVLLEACTQNARTIYGSLGRSPVPAMPGTHADGRDRAIRGVALSEVMAAYRVGAVVLWEELDALTHRKDSGREVIAAAARQMWHVLDTYTEEMTNGYRDELALRAVADAEVRAGLIDAVLGGALNGTDLTDAATALHLPMGGAFTVVMLARSRDEVLLTAHVEHDVKARGMRSLWLVQPVTALGIIVGPIDSPRLVEVLAATGAHAGISPVVDRLEQLPDALRLARLACDGATDGRRVVLFDAEPVAVAAAAAVAVMPRITRTVLGGLLDEPEPYRSTLLSTFWTWACDAGSIQDAARHLFIHPNTVRYRLRKIEELTGRSLSDPRALTELTLAVESAMARQHPDDGPRP